MMRWTHDNQDRRPVTVTAPSRAALLADLRARLQEGRGFTLATLNLDHVVKLRRDPAFRAAYAAHSHVSADGRPIVWLSRLSGQTVELVTGSDLIDPLVKLAAEARCPVALLGSTDAALAAAADALSARHAGLEIVARIAPPMGFNPLGSAAEPVIETLKASGARLCLLALGAPKQELLAARAARALPDTGFVSIGAGLDFIAGTQRRAPRLVRILAAEWLWRLLSDPGRMAGRYAACFGILPELMGRALVTRLQPPGGVKE